jgi:rfaE bifunctional protein nucleotidyltransferase chain/domain
MDKLEAISQKIISFEKLDPILAYWKFLNKKVVFTNGCFDILHRGHIVYLAKAASYGDLLIIGLNSDLSVKNIKGPNRPLQDQESRALIMASLHFVSHVILFDEDTPYNLIKKIQPDVLVKGADYKPQDIVGYDILTAKGGEIVTIDFVEGYSTTGIIKKMNC